LIITGEEGVGKKNLLMNWIEKHKTKQSNVSSDIVVSHFSSLGGNSKKYLYAIYGILITLRVIIISSGFNNKEILDIS